MILRNVRHTNVALLALVALLFLTAVASGRALHPGDVDTSWGDRGELILKAPVARAEVIALSVRDDGWVAAAVASGDDRFDLVWLDPRGRVIRSHRGPDGWRPHDHTMRFDNAGRLLVAGPSGVARYSRNGGLDHTFGHRGRYVLPRACPAVGALMERNNGSLVVACTRPPADRVHILGLTSAGRIDRDFGRAGFVSTRFEERSDARPGYLLVRGLAGGIHVVGTSGSEDSYYRNEIRIERRLADGTLDTRFAGDGIERVEDNLNDRISVTDATLDGHGRLIVAITQAARFYGDVETRFMRIGAFGGLDPGFGVRGRTAPVTAAAPGRIVVLPSGFRFYAQALALTTLGQGVLTVSERGRPMGSKRRVTPVGLGSALSVDPLRNAIWATDPGGQLHRHPLRGRSPRELGRSIVLPAQVGAASWRTLNARAMPRGGVRLQGAAGQSNQRWARDVAGEYSAGMATAIIDTGGQISRSTYGLVSAKYSLTTGSAADGSTCAVGSVQENLSDDAWNTEVLRTLPDGRPDTRFGPRGRRELIGIAASSAVPIGAHSCAVLYERWTDPVETRIRLLGPDRPTRADIPVPDAFRTASSRTGGLYAFGRDGMYRLTRDLRLDSTFGVSGRLDHDVDSLVELEDGRVLLDRSYGSNSLLLDEHGSVIRAFYLGWHSDRWMTESGSDSDVLPLDEGGFVRARLASGSACSECPHERVVVVERYDESGTLDRSFGDGGGAILPSVGASEYLAPLEVIELDNSRIAVAQLTIHCGEQLAVARMIRLRAGSGTRIPRSTAITRGDDVVEGTAWCDTINADAGRDRIRAGDGADVIKARDRERDIIDCGPGRDTVIADPIDHVRNCEVVKLQK